MYRFCNFGHCYDFRPEEKISPYTNEKPISNLEFYKEKVKQAKNKAVYITDETGKIVAG